MRNFYFFTFRLGLPLIFIQLLVSPVHAQHPATRSPMSIWIEEFFRSEAVRSEERGELQTTLLAEGFRRSGSDVDLDFEYGVTGRLQLSVELPYGIRSATQSEVPSSWSTVSLGAQYQFIKSSHPFAFTTGLAASIPVSGRGEFASEPEVIAARQFGNTQVHASLLADLAKDSREYEYNLSSVMNLHSAWFPTVEWNGRRTDRGRNIFYVTPGIYHHFLHRVEAGIAISGGSHFGVVGKITWEAGGDKD